MLRSTVSRAFSAPIGGDRCGVDPGGRKDRSAAIKGLFEELQDAVAQRIERVARQSAVASRPTAAEMAEPRLRDERNVLEGIEFVLDWRGGQLRVRDGLGGALEVDHRIDGQWTAAEWIGVEEQNGHWRPFRKPARSGAPFTYTSVVALAASWVPVESALQPAPSD